MMDQKMRCFSGCGEFRESNKVYHLGESVDNSEDNCATLRWRETSDKVKSYVRPGSAGNRQRTEQASRGAMGGLGLRAYSTCQHKSSGLSVHGWPPEMALDERQGTTNPRMAGEPRGMDPLEDLRTD